MSSNWTSSLRRLGSDRYRMKLIGSFVLSMFAAGCDDKPKCSGAACTDASADAGDDSGSQTGMDAGTDSGVDSGVDAGVVGTCDGLPPGLYVAGSCTVLDPNVLRFAPQYVLWSDGAVKDRYVYLPTQTADLSTRIDATDPNSWIFPVGTIFWKHFSWGSTRVETRMLKKISAGSGSGAWEMRTFVWNVQQDDVTEVVSGMQNALGTPLDIPDAPENCQTCHQTTDVALGFSALQLNHGLPNEVPLRLLIESSRISPMPSAYPDWNTYTTAALIPGTPTERAALGYLHANCSHCHRAGGTAQFMRLAVPVGVATVSALPIFDPTNGAINVAAGWMDMGQPTKRIDPTDDIPTNASHSAIYLRMGYRDDAEPFNPNNVVNQMPPLATETVDSTGRAAVAAFINGLQ